MSTLAFSLCGKKDKISLFFETLNAKIKNEFLDPKKETVNDNIGTIYETMHELNMINKKDMKNERKVIMPCNK